MVFRWTCSMERQMIREQGWTLTIIDRIIDLDRLIDKVELVIRLRHDRLYVSWSTTRVDPRQYH